MTQGYTDFYQFESLWKIMKGEEKRGKLQTDYYSQEVKDISEQLKKLRSKLRALAQPLQAQSRHAV